MTTPGIIDEPNASTAFGPFRYVYDGKTFTIYSGLEPLYVWDISGGAPVSMTEHLESFDFSELLALRTELLADVLKRQGEIDQQLPGIAEAILRDLGEAS